MSFYADYLRERTSDSIIETKEGFASYRYMNEGKSVYIIDIYIVPDARKLGVGSKIAEEIMEEAKKKGCVDLIGTVVPSNKNSTASIDVLRAFGMELQSAGPDLIVFRKAL